MNVDYSAHSLDSFSAHSEALDGRMIEDHDNANNLETRL